MAIPKTIVLEALALIAQGESQTSAAEKVGINRKTLAGYLARYPELQEEMIEGKRELLRDKLQKLVQGHESVFEEIINRTGARGIEEMEIKDLLAFERRLGEMTRELKQAVGIADETGRPLTDLPIVPPILRPGIAKITVEFEPTREESTVIDGETVPSVGDILPTKTESRPVQEEREEHSPQLQQPQPHEAVLLKSESLALNPDPET